MTRPAGAGEAATTPTGRRGLAGWFLYDWANSSFPTVILTFVFSAYVTRAVAPTPEIGTAWWGAAVAVAGLSVAVIGPLLGAVADRGGRRKPWIAGFTLACILLTAALWFIRPEPGYLLPAVLLAAAGLLTFELGQMFYNAMLPDLVARGRLGRISGWAWGLGYSGGLGCLAACLLLLVFPDPPLLGLDAAAQEPVRASALLVAAWFALFSLPLFLFTPDRAATGLPARQALREGLAKLLGTLKGLRGENRDIARFLIARIFYIDGLNTLFAFGGIYAAGSFAMGFQEVLIFGILLNVTAGLGAFIFGWADDRLGAKRTLVIAICCLLVLGAAILVVRDVFWFYVLGAAIGLFVGPVQSASRSLMAHIAPPEARTEMFGLFALAGKIMAFMGPAMVAGLTYISGSQRVGMASILILFLLGLVVLLPLKVRAR